MRKGVRDNRHCRFGILAIVVLMGVDAGGKVVGLEEKPARLGPAWCDGVPGESGELMI